MNVGQCMSTNVHGCSPDDSVQMAASAMRDITSGALLLLVGAVSPGDIGRTDGKAAEAALERISEPGGPHLQ